MNFTPIQQAKIDYLSQTVLTNASENEYLTVIIVLQKDEPIDIVKQTVTALQNLSLDIQWQGKTIPVLVAKGLKSQIVEAVNLQEVQSIFLTQIVNLITKNRLG